MHQTLAAVADDRRFFTGMAFLALIVVLAGFGNTYYFWPWTQATLHPSGQPVAASLAPAVHLHAVAFTAWMVLFIVQVGLVSRNEVRAHRRLGRAMAWLVPALLVTGVVTAIGGARNGWNPGGPFRDALAFLIVGLFDLLVFGVLTGAALWFRRRPDLHKRLMLLGTLGGLMWPAITRIPFLAGRFLPMFSVLTLLVLAPAIRDFVIGARTRWMSLLVGVAILLMLPLRAVVGNSGWWRSIATWLIQ
jgi:hypothetical protein